MIALFGLFAEVERDLISERTKEGLAVIEAPMPLLKLLRWPRRAEVYWVSSIPSWA